MLKSFNFIFTKKNLFLLLSRNVEDASGGKVGFQSGNINVSREFVGTVDFTSDGSMSIVTDFVTAVDQDFVSRDFDLKFERNYTFLIFLKYLNFIWSEELNIESDFELFGGVGDSDNSVVVLKRPVPGLSNPIVSNRNASHLFSCFLNK